MRLCLITHFLRSLVFSSHSTWHCNQMQSNENNHKKKLLVNSCFIGRLQWPQEAFKYCLRSEQHRVTKLPYPCIQRCLHNQHLTKHFSVCVCVCVCVLCVWCVCGVCVSVCERMCVLEIAHPKLQQQAIYASPLAQLSSIEFHDGSDGSNTHTYNTCGEK